jgi:hypothetical protein
VRSESIRASVSGLLLGLAAAWPAYSQATADGRVSASEADLWQRITALRELPPATTLLDDWFDVARERRRALVMSLGLYLTLYPGGAHRDAAIPLELDSLFELSTLQGDTLVALQRRAAEVLRAPPSEAVLHEAAYWGTLIESWQTPRVTSGPTAADPALDARRSELYRAYVDRYPRSRFAPRLASALFEAAAARDDRATMQYALAVLRAHHPRHATTAQVEAERRRETAVGQPYWPELQTIAGRPIDRGQHLGAPVLIVVWAGFDQASRACVQDIERFRTEHPELRVIGVSLDDDAAQTADAGRVLGLDWPQCNDGLGWGGTFVRSWAIGRIPYVLAIDRAGRLIGLAAAEDWRSLAHQAINSAAN